MAELCVFYRLSLQKKPLDYLKMVVHNTYIKKELFPCSPQKISYFLFF